MKMKILILYGPNLNLLGIWSANRNKTITLDKLNRHIRKYIRNKKIDAIITVPGVWQYNAYGLAEVLELTNIPFITITYKEKDYIKLLNGKNNITDEDLYNAMSTAINEITNEYEK